MRRPTSMAIGILCVLAAVGCGSQSPTSSTSPSTSTSADTAAPAGRIVFRRYLAGSETQAALFTSNTDGSNEFQLTHPAAAVVDDEPSWAPDGSRVVFSRNAGTGTDHEVQRIYTVGADGSGLTALSPELPTSGNPKILPGADQGPVYSPDGKQIAFNHIGGKVAVAGEHGLPPGFDQIEFSEIFVMNADGSHRRQVSHHPAYSGDSGTGVAWSPDGRQVVYRRFNSPGFDPTQCRSLFVIGIDGRGERQLTPCSLHAGGTPDWSATGLIVFRAVADEELGVGNFFTVDADGGQPTQVTHFDNTVISHKVGFSPDGTGIVFSQEIDGANDVFTAKLDGSDLRAVTTTPESDSSPDWGSVQ